MKRINLERLYRKPAASKNLCLWHYSATFLSVEKVKFMQKTTTVRARVESKLKTDAEAVLQKLGLTTSQAIIIYLKQITLYKGIPFEVKIPNETTLKALEDAKRKRNLKTFKNTDELFENLEI